MRRVAWLAAAACLSSCIEFERGGAYACAGFDDCAERESCFQDACTAIAPLTGGELAGRDRVEWAVAWVQWMQRLPLRDHPLYDATGEHCGAGQPADAFFLSGDSVSDIFDNTTDRTCTVKAGVPLVFPIFWWVDDNNGRSTLVTEGEMKDTVVSAVGSAEDLLLRVDGHTFTEAELAALRIPVTRLAYSLDREDPLYPPLDGQPHDVSPAYVDGYFVVLPPLRPGVQHELRFGASFTAIDGSQVKNESRYVLEVR